MGNPLDGPPEKGSRKSPHEDSAVEEDEELPPAEKLTLSDLPEYLQDIALAFDAVEGVYRGLAEDPEWEKYGGGTQEERREIWRALSAFAPVDKDRGRYIHRRQRLVKEPDGFFATEDGGVDEEGKAEFYRPYIENLRTRLYNLMDAFVAAGKRLPKMIVTGSGNAPLVMSTESLSIARIPVHTKKIFGRTVPFPAVHERVPAESKYWFSVRWDVEFLKAGLKKHEFNAVTALVAP